jgi:hypothetical protein
MPDNGQRKAIFYGPLLLAGDFGPDEDPDAAPAGYVHAIVGDGTDPEHWIEPVAGQPNRFRTLNAGVPGDVELVPFYALHDRRYSVYWDFFPRDTWKQKEGEYLKDLAREKDLQERTVAMIHAGDGYSEASSGTETENTSTGWTPDGRSVRFGAPAGKPQWFSYRMQLPAQGGASVVMRIYAGPESGKVGYTLSIDDFEVSQIVFDPDSERFPEKIYKISGEYFETVYEIPPDLTKGKKAVRLKLAAVEGLPLASFNTIRVVRKR